ncbi:uncharacterized protein B0H18DRAFT_995072 [Fomitopsis serialis]|uniref:uncharacterized protein n=1 Tax=Fomitopsis serialis TaxID=139415 RepID=UPI00200855AF|nr:uncharacterized protein B0H18DRAFT_995072 [Neoantrodia serialis]KAH9930063.1 hypothetical protein B0H18DRAFT_995072 [Neoantrodia serialis]
MAKTGRLEAMNASPNHSKVKVSLKLPDGTFVAGGVVTGKMEMECKADRGLGIGVIMVELFAVEELTSRDHSATSTFLHTRRLFQGQGLPPSNAVHPYPDPGDPPLPSHYYHARRGATTFLFRLPLPTSSPSAINFGSGLAHVRYEVRATVGVFWKGENRLVFDKKPVDVVESFDEELLRGEPEAVVVGENGKIWAQGKVVGGFLVAGQAGCVELQVKNHSPKKNTGLSVSLTRELVLPSQPPDQKQPLQISDTLTSVSFRGPEYIIHQGSEGVATLVFDLPRNARGIKGGRRQGDEETNCTADPLFEVRCLVNVKLTMGIGSKDIMLSIPVTVLDPIAVPTLPAPEPYLAQSPPLQPYGSPVFDPHYMSAMSPPPFMDRPLSPYSLYGPPMSPPLVPYVDQGQVWLPPPVHSPYYHASSAAPMSPPLSPPIPQHYYYQHPPHIPQSLVAPYAPPPRPSSVEPISSESFHGLPSGLPTTPVQQPLLPLHTGNHSHPAAEREEGKGERASRIALHLRMSSRHRSASPPAHRYAMPTTSEAHTPTALLSPTDPMPIQPSLSHASPAHSPSSSPQTPQRRPQTLNLSVSPALSQGSVASPRPMLSPKHSFSIDPFTVVTPVEQLERIAAQVDCSNADMSGPGGSPALDKRDKTLPRVPQDTRKPSPGSTRPKADTLFPPDAVPMDHTPPTPALAAVTSLKASRNNLSVGGGLSGLDALEAKLLAEVGTRKVESSERHPDVRSVMPITIPRHTEGDPANDSAISSLTLPGLDAEVKTLHVGQNLELPHDLDLDDDDDDRALTERWVSRKSKENVKSSSSTGTRKSKDKNKDKERRSGKRSAGNGTAGKNEEVHHMRKTAQGRVTAWLGSIEPDAPPQSSTPPPLSPAVVADLSDVVREDAQGRVAAWLGSMRGDASKSGKPPASPKLTGQADEPLHQVSQEIPQTETPRDVSAAPNPRSSGFMPMGTYRAQKQQRQDAAEAARVEHARALKTPVSPRLAVYPPRPQGSEVHYDIRSARGGKGGKVTAVAAIWASATQQSKVDPSKPISPPNDITRPRDVQRVKSAASKSPPQVVTKASHAQPAKIAKAGVFSASNESTSKPTSVADLTARRARMIKSTSVPAVVSSSLATPMLSSTASLARPAPAALDRNRANKLNGPRVADLEMSLPSVKEDSTKPPATKGELAFGQARLRELIKRYQGQAS